MSSAIRKMGWVRDLPDQRDFKYSAHPEYLKLAAQVFPESVDLRGNCPPIKDQGNLSSCVANAMAFILEYIAIKNLKEGKISKEVFGKIYAAISRLFFYYNSRLFDGPGAVLRDDGTQIRNVVKAVKKYGICLEGLWRYEEHQVFTRPALEAYEQGKLHLNTSGYRINNSKIAAMKACLVAGYPFEIGVSLYESFNDVGKNGLVTMPESIERMIGGHAMAAVGYDDVKEVVIVANSWNTTFGDQGYCFMPYDYLTSFYLASDFWTMREG